MCGLHEKANLLHPPAVQTTRGGEKCSPTSSQREGAQLPVDALNVLRSWLSRLSAFARGRHDCQCDGAGSTAATLGRRRSLTDEARSWRRAEDGRVWRRRRLPVAPVVFAGVHVLA